MVLEMRGITKTYPGVIALEDVSLRVAQGEVHAIVGENGAGKSTLMNILAGAVKRDMGTIAISGREVDINCVQDARSNGISIVYQHLNLIPDISVADNLCLAALPIKRGRLHKARILDEASRRLKELHAEIDPGARLGDLSVADQQLVAIARAITPETRILIMDEPTSSLTPKEVEGFFRVVRDLKRRGVSVIFISHHLDEIFSITDRITVLRDGKFIGEWKTSDLTDDELISAMAGRPVTELFPKIQVELGDTVLEISDLSSRNSFMHVDFHVRAGEIFGIGGLVGSGRSEILKAIFGELPATGGQITLSGVRMESLTPKQAVKNGIAYISEDRGGEGLVLDETLSENITLPRLSTFVRSGRLNKTMQRDESARLSAKLGVKAANMEVKAATLSGGNQQKVALAKWFGLRPKVLLLDEPTRGIDIGAKADIYRLLGELAREGVAIVMVSSELPELLAVSDTILVMCKGKQAGMFSRGAATAESVMMAATGGIK